MKTVSGISQLSMEKSGVYIIVCTANNKFYIGSCECLGGRFEQQDSKFATDEMEEDAKKYGSDSFMFDVLCTCNYKITTLVENYYIKKYEAIKKGYNKINAPKNLKEGSGKFEFIFKTGKDCLDEEIRLDYENNKLLDILMVDMFDYQNSKNKIIISLDELLAILKLDFKVDLSENIKPIFYVIHKLDLDIYVKNNENDVYIISGKEIFNFLDRNRMYSLLRTDKKIDQKLKIDICTPFNLNNIFVKCPKLHKDFKYNVNYKDSNEFKSKYNIIDIRYTHYLDTEYSSNRWQYKLIPYCGKVSRR
ncbi:GIY-YIG nuclease family protein [Clostridium sp. UBA4395]|uniref:GIY-YIG nuclease family protein n=1 Tax=Clostridium sp. UBA4395 TaxID=1946360 RepID=UPI0032177939